MLLALALVLTLALSLSHSGQAISDAPGAAAVKAQFLAANALLQNLGAPAPVGVTSSDWPTHSFARRERDGKALGVAVQEHRWLDASGHPQALSAQAAGALIQEQSRLAQSLFVGASYREVSGQLASLVQAERASPPTPSSPGGVQVLQWLSLKLEARTAKAEALLEEWDQRDSFALSASGRSVLVSSLDTGEVDATATLVELNGHWLVSSLNKAPWQEAT